MNPLHTETQVVVDDIAVPDGFAALVRPTHRGSTILFKTAADFLGRGAAFYTGYTYGLAGTPTHYALAGKLAALEGARHCALAPSGLAAIHLVNQTVLDRHSHVLVPDTAYGPTRRNALELLQRFGVETTFYPPDAGAGIASLIRPHTRLVWTESPCSLTMDMQDVPAIVAAAHERGVQVAIDNTWATPLYFDALGHGVDFSVQALTKYPAGHSNVLMGSVCVNDTAAFQRLKTTSDLMGSNVSPDDCAAVMLGLGTMAIRLERHCASALKIAAWLERQPQVRCVMHPALPSHPGHAIWKRDFRGASGLFSLVLEGGLPQACHFLDALSLFQLGASWGGLHSLAAIYRADPLGGGVAAGPHDHLVRLHVGLESPDDLIDDLARALSALPAGACA